MNRQFFIYLILFLLFLATGVIVMILLKGLGEDFAMDGLRAVLNVRGAVCLILLICNSFLARVLFHSAMTALGETVQIMLTLIWLVVFFYPILVAFFTALLDRFIIAIPA